MSAQLQSKTPREPAAAGAARLAQRLGLFDATMIVMGGMVGAGIFMNPYVVARQVHTPVLILGAWVLGGLVAMAGALVYAELAARCPQVGGQYAYLREAYHPSVAFVYGWGLLLVTQSGGMAAVAVTFARYFLELTHAQGMEKLVATLALAGLALINCLGVRTGGTVQNAFMVMKILAIAALVGCGMLLAQQPQSLTHPVVGQPLSFDLLTAFGAALIPVLFAYGGWQTSSFISAEMRQPRKDLPRGLVLGTAGVLLLYVGVNVVCVRVLGPERLAGTTAPATEVMRLLLGEEGARLIALGIAVSTLGFLSQSILTAPRVYFAMAQDRVFFQSVGRVSSRTRVPTVAILLQAAVAIVIAVSGRYEQILSYVVAMDFIFFGTTATCLFAFRRRDRWAAESNASAAVASDPKARALVPFRTPGHPLTTLFFIAVSWLVVANTFYKYPWESLTGLALVLSGIPVYFLWQRSSQQ